MRNSLCLVWVTWSVISLLGCSDSESSRIAARAPVPAFSVFASETGGDDHDELLRSSDGAEVPVVESLTLEPKQPVSRERVRALAKLNGRWTSVKYEWSINGERFGGNTAEVVLPVIKTGDTVSVRVVPIRGVLEGQAKSTRIRVRNQRPMILEVRIEREEEGIGNSRGSDVIGTDFWRASARVEDPDGDPVDIRYRWYLNGILSETHRELFPADDLVRGDRIQLEARAYDGRAWSRSLRSGEVEVGNSPPTIVSKPPRVDASGRFRYQVLAEDADGDSVLRFELRQAPRGMQIDESRGLVRWQPGTDQAGRHTVEIVVTDQGGAQTMQSFSLALVTRTADRVSPAAPR